ncbi:potassium transporter TrkG [Bacteroides uniformis]|nr:potassium transporter TrkG [Bacteroides uniformis]
MINFKTIIRIIGILLLLETVMFLVCSSVSFYYRESDMLDFWKAGGITAGIGLLLAALGKGGERQLTRRDGYVLVSFAWVAFSLFGMLPFYIGGYIPDIADAFFETMSGFSSTGATILDDIESLPHGILFWRSMTQWIGGLGIIMFTIAVLPIFGVSGLQVFAAEASGPTHDKVHPRIGITAKWIWSIYTGITTLLVCLLMLGGMDWFDSICHAFATTGTGGFSTKQASVAYYNSPYPKKRRKLPYSYSPALSWLRYGVLGVFIIALIAGIGSLAALLAPYSAYGRIANNLFQPIWQWGNNLLAYLAERADSYAFYETDVWLKSLPTFIIAAATLAVLVVLAGRNGRTYCNTICPVGTVLGFLSRYSLFRITIDSEKCNQCSLCSRNCKAACINFKEHQIDASRCVVCMNCIEKCKHGAISYKYHPFGKPAAGKADSEQINETRRSFFTATALVAATSVLKAQEKKVDGGLAAIEDKPNFRNTFV